MIQMSRKAWNNVVIFSMLLMIFFLNGLHYKLNPDDDAAGIQAVLPEQSFVLTIAFPGYKVERIGTSWRIALPPEEEKDFSEAALKALVAKWQSAQLLVTDKPEKMGQALSAAQLWLATQELPLSYQLYQSESDFYLFDKQKQRWFALTLEQAKALFSPIEF
ncbi:hypothetical protein [Pseudoalteromonas piscicida]|uniref:hypothetical protein n=1 Tax=Pseudoalteromonas piscicida TaxID=43662 RepID=UPI0030A38A3E